MLRLLAYGTAVQPRLSEDLKNNPRGARRFELCMTLGIENFIKSMMKLTQKKFTGLLMDFSEIYTENRRLIFYTSTV